MTLMERFERVVQLRLQRALDDEMLRMIAAREGDARLWLDPLGGEPKTNEWCYVATRRSLTLSIEGIPS